MNKQVVLDKMIKNLYLKKIYYFIKGNKISKDIDVDFNGRLIKCNIFQDKGCKGNQINILKGTTLTECSIEFHGNNNKILIGKGSQLLQNQIIVYDDNNCLSIGERLNSGKNTKFVLLEGESINIGDECLFSYDIELRNSDSHTLLDENGVRCNQAKSIVIGDRVWIAQRSLILKGASIGEDCVVAANTVVTSHTFEKGSLIVGIPGVIKKKSISWNINRL